MMPKVFDAATLDIFRTTAEISIQADRKSARPVVIWVVVANGAAFVRSVRGPKGRWFIAAKAAGQATLETAGRRMAVRVVPVTDRDVIEAVSQAFLTKYATSPYAQAMVRPENLATTLRLDPV